MSSAGGDAFTFGRMLEHLRDEVRRLSQGELAERMCAELNERTRDVANPPRRISQGAMRTAISLAEQNKRRLDGPKGEVAAHALRVPAIWFDNPARSWSAFLENLNVWLQNQLAETVQPRVLKEAPNPTGQPRFLHRIGSLPKSPDHAVFRHRGQAFQELNEAVFGRPGSAVYCLKGPLGIGKSTLLHHWCQRESHRLKERGVLAIHCIDKTGDDLLEELVEYYGHCGIKDPANSLPELIANSPMVLILDAIERFDRNDISGSNLSPQLFLEAILGPAFQQSANVKVIVTYSPEAVSGVPDILEFLNGLAGEARYREVELPGLHPDDAADYLSKSGLDVSKEILRKFSQEVEGNPALLSAFLASVSRSDGPVAERVQYLSLFGKEAVAPNAPTTRTEVFRELVARSRAHSPEVFTTLMILTACHDGFEPDELQQLISRLLSNDEFLRASELERSETVLRMDFLGGPLAGLIRTTPRFKKPGSTAVIKAKGGKRSVVKSLHALARLEIANLLAEVVAPVARIIVHRELASYYFDLVPSSTHEGYIPNAVDIERYHNILHHLTSMYDIAATPVGDQPSKRLAKKATADVRGLKEEATDQFSTAAVLANPTAFLEGVFKDVMMLHLGNESRVIGRQLGHFERKLAMLGLFYKRTEAAGDGGLGVKDGLGQKSRRTLFYETAVVANYTGRLSIAHKAVSGAIGASSRTSLPTAQQLEQAVRASLRGGQDADALRVLASDLDAYTALLNVSATTYCREGHISVAEKLLEGPFASTTQLFAPVHALVGSDSTGTSTAPRRVRSNLLGILLGLRRVASKLGQVKTYKNDLAAAAQAFDVALNLEHLRSATRVLRGETGRAYCRFLLASQDDQVWLQVPELIRVNIEHSKAFKRHYEVLEWLIELVHFECQYGAIETAQAALTEIDELTKVQGVGLSFSAQKELEIERCRVDMRLGDQLRSDRLKAGLQSCKLSNHELLACETQLLLSQSERSVDDQVFWRREAEEIMNRTGYLLPTALGTLS